MILMEHMPAIEADSLSIAYGDFSTGYLIVDRIDRRLSFDPFTSKPFIIVYMYRRLGGDVANFHAVKLMKFFAS